MTNEAFEISTFAIEINFVDIDGIRRTSAASSFSPEVPSVGLKGDPENQMAELGAEVRRLREEKDLSQDELARNASVSKPSLSRIERGEVVPSILLLEQITGVLGVDLADLIRTGYDPKAIAMSTTGAELIDLVGRMTEPQKELALGLLKVVAQYKKA